jgi:hypothetical protein
MGYWWLWLVVLGVIVLVDWLIIRAVWCATSESQNGKAESPSGAASRGGGKKALAICAAIVLLVAALPPVVTYLSLSAVKFAAKLPASPARVVAVERKLQDEIQRRLSENGWKPQGLSVSVTPDLKRAECRFGRICRNGLTTEPPPPAAIHLEPRGNGLWLIRGEGELQALRFSVDTSAEMAMRQEEPPRAAVALAASLGPVRETTLNDLDEYRGNELLDLDAGRTLDLDREFEKWPREQQAQWLKTNGVDLMLDRAKAQWGLITPQDNATRLVLVTHAHWEGGGRRAVRARVESGGSRHSNVESSRHHRPFAGDERAAPGDLFLRHRQRRSRRDANHRVHGESKLRAAAFQANPDCDAAVRRRRPATIVWTGDRSRASLWRAVRESLLTISQRADLYHRTRPRCD